MTQVSNPNNQPEQWVRFSYPGEDEVEYIGQILGAQYVEGEWNYWITCQGSNGNPYFIPENSISLVVKSS